MRDEIGNGVVKSISKISGADHSYFDYANDTPYVNEILRLLAIDEEQQEQIVGEKEEERLLEIAQ